ncbi:MAG: TetR/AcrR family transcriptional regulator [Chloroflexota bacterium]
MGVKERKDRERQQLKQNILDATRSIALHDGWQAVTIRKVADRIEYSPPTIYEHFASKEDILVELMRQGFQILFQELDKLRETTPDPEARLLAMAQVYWEFAWTYPDLYQVMHGLGGVPFCDEDRPLPIEAKQAFMITQETLQDLAARENLQIDNLHDSVHIIWATLHGLVALTMANRIVGGRQPIAALVERAMKQFIVSLRISGSA